MNQYLMIYQYTIIFIQEIIEHQLNQILNMNQNLMKI